MEFNNQHIFLKSPIKVVELQQTTFINWPVNIKLVKCVKCSMFNDTDDEQIFKIKFDNDCIWCFKDINIRDKLFMYISDNDWYNYEQYCDEIELELYKI